MRRQDQARANRAAMPRTAAEVDTWRAVFGEATRVVWAEEGGVTVGQRPKRRTMDVDQWIHYIKTGDMP